MPCPYLEGESLKVARFFPAKRDPAMAGKGMMILSVGELNDYCTTEEVFTKCEFFKEAESGKAEIKEEEVEGKG